MTALEPSPKKTISIAWPRGGKLVMTLGNQWKDTCIASVMSLIEGKTLPDQMGISSSNKARALKVFMKGSPFFVKFFASRGIRDNLALRKSRSFRAMKGGDMLATHGFNTPALIAQGDLIKKCIILDSFLITQWIEGLDIYKYVDAIFKPPVVGEALTRKRNFVKNIGQLIGRLHRTGIVHGDLRPGNILIQHSAGEPSYYFIDNERNIFL